MTATIYVDMRSAQFAIHCDEENVAATVAELWSLLVLERPTEGLTCIDVSISNGPPWQLHREQESITATSDPWALMVYLRAVIDDEAIRHSTDPRVHAVAVNMSGCSILIPGDAGAGKTTLATALVKRGARLLLDDLGFLRIDDGTIVPVPRPIGLKAGVDSGWSSPAWMGRPTGVHLIPAHSLGASSLDQFRPDVLVFTRFVPSGGSSIRPLSGGEAIARLGRFVTPVTGELMPTLSQICHSARLFALEHDSSETAAGLVDRAIAEGPPVGGE